MSATSPEISIIVPIYNTASLLSRCIESIQKQSFKDWECILVNDGSTDQSLAVALRYVEKDSRIVLHSKENGGVSSARNWGIKHARGEFIVFVDSDDEILPDYLKTMHQAALKKNADLIVSGVKRDWKNHGVEVFSNTDSFAESSDSEFYRISLCTFATAVGKLYRRSVIQSYGIYFDTRYNYWEDILFYISYLSECRNIASTSYDGYVYYQEHPKAAPSLSTLKTRPFQTELELYQQIFELTSKAIQRNPKMRNEIIASFRNATFISQLFGAATREGRHHLWKRRELLSQIPIDYISTKDCVLSMKVRYSLLKYGLPLLCALSLIGK